MLLSEPKIKIFYLGTVAVYLDRRGRPGLGPDLVALEELREEKLLQQ